MRRRIVWATVAVTAGVIVGAWRFLALVGFGDDHYVHLAGAQQIMFGEWPSRDFVDAGAPLMYALSAVVLWLAPQVPLFGEAVLMALMFGLGAVLTVYAARPLTGSLVLAILAVALEIVIFPRTYSYPKVLTYAVGFLAMWRYVDRPSLTRMVQIAGVVVASFLLRYDHGIYIGFGGLVTVMVAARPASESLKKAAIYAVVVLALMTPYLAYVQYYDGLTRHLRRGMELSALENSRGRRAPEFMFDGNLTSNALPWLYYEFHLLPLVSAVVVLARWRRSSDGRELAMIVPLIAVAVPMNVGLIRETVSARLPDAVVPAALQLAWLLSCIRDVRPAARRVVAWATAVVVVGFTGASVVVIGATKEQLDRAQAFDGLARVTKQFSDRASQLRARLPAEQMPSRTAHALLPFFAYADRCLTQSDHVLVPAFLPEVPVWARRPFAGGQVVFQAGALDGAEDHRQVMERLNRQRVPVVVLSSDADLVTAEFGELAGFIASHFPDMIPVSVAAESSIRVGFDPRMAVKRDAETGWWCYR
jgi:hypothetical protein